MKRFTSLLVWGMLAMASARPLLLEDDYSFEEYLRDYNKEYRNEVELAKRRAIFEKRVHDIKKHNSHGKAGYKKGVNHLTDWTEEELGGMLGYKAGSTSGPQAKASAPTIMSFHEAMLADHRGGESVATARRLSSLPDSVNWAEVGAMTPPKDQGKCGSCWSFSGTEAIESDLYLNSGKLVKLSQQEFVSCMDNPDECGGKGGCEGATQELLFQFAVDKGLVLEEDYPYASGAGNEPMCTLAVKQPVGGLLGYVRVPTNDYTSLLQAINLKPIAISVDASEWHNYHSGVLDFKSCGSTINHAVLLAGYGTDPELGDYWLVRNSWGPGWGEGGYIRLSRETGCAVDSNPRDGSGCRDGPANVTVCGTCGILYDNSFPVGSYFL